MTSTHPAVELDGLTKTFGAVTAVDGLSLRVQPGEVVAFLGPNGAGKTTTIDMLLGLARPDAGTVRILGGTPDDAVARGRVAAVLQTGGLLKDLTVGETVEMSAHFYRHTRPAAEVLERAGIADIAGRVVGRCSGGQQQRLRFALALLPDPDLMVLDEPTTGMDVEGRRDFWQALRRDARAGRTVIFATHYLDEADAYADRIVRATCPAPTRLPSPRCPGWTPWRYAATACWCAPATRTPSPGTCSPAPPPGTWRSPRATSKTPSSP